MILNPWDFTAINTSLFVGKKRSRPGVGLPDEARGAAGERLTAKNHGKTMGKPWENHGNMVTSPTLQWGNFMG